MLYMQTSNIRTTIYLDEDLYMKAKKKALEERTTLTKLIKNGLKREIAKKNKKKTKSKRNALLEIAKFRSKLPDGFGRSGSEIVILV